MYRAIERKNRFMKRFFAVLIIIALMSLTVHGRLPESVPNEGDVMLLARLITAECDGRDWTEMVECGALCVARTKNGLHCTTIAGVIFEKGLYESVSNGRIYVRPTVLAIRAAEEALFGMLSEG